MNSPVTRLPVTVIGGYLGAGKTTVINQMLHQAAQRDEPLRLAILVNDFGDLPIDADLIQGQTDNLMQLAGGCVCCSIGSDLIGALTQLPDQANGIDHVVIETSGVAMPGTVAATAALAPGMRRQGVIVLADALNLTRQRQDQYIGDTIERQLDAADLIVLTKVDATPPTQYQSLLQSLQQQYCATPVVPASNGEVPLAVLLDAADPASDTIVPRRHAFAPGTDADAMYRSVRFDTNLPVAATQLRQALTDPALAILRAKGFVRNEQNVLQLVQVVGTHAQISDEPGRDVQTGLIIIGLRDQLDSAALAAKLKPLGMIPSG